MIRAWQGEGGQFRPRNVSDGAAALSYTVPKSNSLINRLLFSLSLESLLGRFSNSIR